MKLFCVYTGSLVQPLLLWLHASMKVWQQHCISQPIRPTPLFVHHKPDQWMQLALHHICSLAQFMTSSC